MDLSKLTKPERLVAGGGMAMLAISFFPWFRHGPLMANAWDNPASTLAVLIAVAVALHLLLSRFGAARMPRMPVPVDQVRLGAGAAVLGLVILQLALGSGGDRLGLRLDPSYGLAMAAAAAVAMLYGGVLGAHLGQPGR